MSLEHRNFETIDDLLGIASSLEKDLGLPDGFLQSLRKSDDWSFIIKVHALMEASVSHLLVHHFGDERLSRVFEFMELSDKRRGKIAIVSALELLPDLVRRFLAKLSELRNSVVHNVNQVGFKLPDYVRGLNKDQFEVFAKSVESIDYDEVDFGPNNEHRREWVANAAKELIYRSALYAMVMIYQNKEIAELKRELAAKAIDQASQLAAVVRRGSAPPSDDAT
jgi:hypothetical protein